MASSFTLTRAQIRNAFIAALLPHLLRPAVLRALYASSVPATGMDQAFIHRETLVCQVVTRFQVSFTLSLELSALEPGNVLKSVVSSNSIQSSLPRAWPLHYSPPQELASPLRSEAPEGERLEGLLEAAIVSFPGSSPRALGPRAWSDVAP